MKKKWQDIPTENYHFKKETQVLIWTSGGNILYTQDKLMVKHNFNLKSSATPKNSKFKAKDTNEKYTNKHTFCIKIYVWY